MRRLRSGCPHKGKRTQGHSMRGCVHVGRVRSGPRLSSCSEETRARCENELADVTCFLGPVENIPIFTEPIRMFPRWSARKPQMSLWGCGWGVRSQRRSCRGLPVSSGGRGLPSPQGRQGSAASGPCTCRLLRRTDVFLRTGSVPEGLVGGSWLYTSRFPLALFVVDLGA